MAEAAGPDVERLALERLGLLEKLGPAVDAPREPGEGLLDALVRRGSLRAHQAAAVRQFLEQRTPPSLRDVLPTVPRALGPGARVGPLEVIEEIGRGATARVYRARHLQLGRVSALKVLPDAALDGRRRARFEREVEALGRLDHPSIVRVHAAFVDGEALAFEMALVEGESLEARIARTGPLPWRQACEVVAALAEAVEHAHGHGVLHRDLKPANVLLPADGSPALVADFGLARFLDSGSLTDTGALVGTPVYMAPEAFSGKTGPLVDVYGLGATLYHALAGVPPYEGTSLVALGARIARGACAPLRVPGLPARVEAIRARAMAPAPEERPSAAELGRELRAVLEGEPSGASLASRPGGRALLAVASLALVLAAGLWRLGASSTGASALAPSRIDAALAALEPGASPPSRREQARLELERALAPSDPASEALVARLEALGPGPIAPALAYLRARAAWARGRAVRLDDLVAASRAPDVPAELEAFAAAALERGPVDGGALERLRELRERRPRSTAAASLLALAALATGDPRERDEAARALRSVRPTAGVALHAVRALDVADRLAAALSTERPRQEAAAAASNMEDLRALAAAPGLGLAPRVVLAPVSSAALAVWHSGALSDATNKEHSFAWLSGLSRCASGSLPPAILVLREQVPGISGGAGWSELARAAREVAAADPLLAAGGLAVASGRAVDERALRAEIAALCSDAEAALAVFERAVESPSFFESRTAARARLEVRLRSGVLQEEMATGEAAAGERAALERALACYRAAFDQTVHDPSSPGEWRNEAARRLVRLLGRLERWDELEAALRVLSGVDGVAAEVVRRRGDPATALGLARAALARSPDDRAALATKALAEADLGQTDAAEVDLATLARASAHEPILLDSQELAAVRAHVAAHLAR